MSTACPICNQSGTIKIRDMVRGNKPIQVYRCEDCLLDFLESWDDAQRAYEFYDTNQYVWRPNVTGEYLKFNEYEIRFRQVRPWLKADTRLLDIGCGEGIFLRMVRSIVAEAEGCEITPSHVKQLREDGFKIWDCPLSEIQPEKPYDILCMHAVLEHIPNVTSFLEDLKRFMHEDTKIFIEVPTLLDPLVYFYDIPEYRDFFYREYRFYYFTSRSLGKLLEKTGFKFEMEPLMQASITNHFHWMHQGKGQPTTNDMVNITLPRKLLAEKAPSGESFMSILNEVDDFYRRRLIEAGIGDLLSCRAWLKPGGRIKEKL